jgi:hypothetical protein
VETRVGQEVGEVSEQDARAVAHQIWLSACLYIDRSPTHVGFIDSAVPTIERALAAERQRQETARAGLVEALREIRDTQPAWMTIGGAEGQTPFGFIRELQGIARAALAAAGTPSVPEGGGT